MLIAQLLSGIIIDKFGDLRDETDKIKEDEKTYCFICGLDRERI
jgi:uncharacterized membrane protein YdcZ (DUF606 family)